MVGGQAFQTTREERLRVLRCAADSCPRSSVVILLAAFDRAFDPAFDAGDSVSCVRPLSNCEIDGPA